MIRLQYLLKLKRDKRRKLITIIVNNKKFRVPRQDTTMLHLLPYLDYSSIFFHTTTAESPMHFCYYLIKNYIYIFYLCFRFVMRFNLYFLVDLCGISASSVYLYINSFSNFSTFSRLSIFSKAHTSANLCYSSISSLWIAGEWCEREIRERDNLSISALRDTRRLLSDYYSIALPSFYNPQEIYKTTPYNTLYQTIFL